MEKDQIREDFSRRLHQACSANPEVPPLNYGRNRWVAERMTANQGTKVTSETVRKWFDGITLPRPERMVALAATIGVDLNWLAYGIGGDRPIARSAASSLAMARKPEAIEMPPDDVAKYLAIGLVQVGGGMVTEIPKEGPVHFRAQIKGAEYSFHAALGVQHGKGWRFVVPAGVEHTFVLGILPLGPARFRMIELDPEVVAKLGKAASGGAAIDVSNGLSTGSHQWREITTFAQRP